MVVLNNSWYLIKLIVAFRSTGTTMNLTGETMHYTEHYYVTGLK